MGISTSLSLGANANTPTIQLDKPIRLFESKPAPLFGSKEITIPETATRKPLWQTMEYNADFWKFSRQYRF